MPHYYLHLRDGEQFIEDPEGSDLLNLEAAREEAIHGARDILAEKLKAGKVLNGQRIEITNEAGQILDPVLFKDTYRVA